LSTPGGRHSWHTSASSSTPSGASSAALQDERVAGAERGADLEGGKQHRRVPRNDGADHAERLPPRVAQDLLAQGDSLALEFPTQPAEVADDVDRRLRLGAPLGAERVPGLERDRVRKLLNARLESVGNPREKPPALTRDCARPGGKGVSRGVHCASDILGAAARNLSDRPAVRRILDLELLTRSALDPFPADQHACLP